MINGQASLEEASQVLSPKLRPLARGNRKKRCDHAAGASGAGPAEAVLSSPLTPPRIVWRASESSATPDLSNDGICEHFEGISNISGEKGERSEASESFVKGL